MYLPRLASSFKKLTLANFIKKGHQTMSFFNKSIMCKG